MVGVREWWGSRSGGGLGVVGVRGGGVKRLWGSRVVESGGGGGMGWGGSCPGVVASRGGGV